jgi:NAD(P)-dependent dehydrogenase (short-subunit alcohol dehydrogenase family)
MAKPGAVVVLLLLFFQKAVGELPKHWGEPRFKGKRVLVTGGDSGIGFAAVQAFYLECAKVLLVGHSEAKSKAAFTQIRNLGVPSYCSGSHPDVLWAAADVGNASAVAAVLGYMVQEFGGMDIAVNNAGTGGHADKQIGDPGFVTSSGELDDESILAVNLAGTLKCMNQEIQHWLNASIPGVMINVASVCGEIAWCAPLYSSSKWAMIGFTKQAAHRYADKGIRINALAPGAVNTTMLRNGMSPTDPAWISEKKMIEKGIPAGRIAEPWEMAGPITFLASDMANYITGDVLTADGDFTQGKPALQWHHQQKAAAAVVEVEQQQASAVAAEEVPKHWAEPRFKGKRALVTGGDSGIGLAAVQALYLECAQVLLVGHSEEKSKAAFDEVRSLPVPLHCSDSSPKVAWASADVSNASQVDVLITRIVQEFGGMDIAVNNAGTAGTNPTKQIGEPGFVSPSGGFYDDSIMSVNFGGTLKCMHAEIAYWLKESIRGVMINVASIAGEVSWVGTLYGSSKWAMIGFTKEAALQYASKGIRINALAPGAVNTTMLRNGLSPWDPRWILKKRAFEAAIPAGRIAEPWEMAGPITFLASDMSSYVTGAVLTADGDISQANPMRETPDLFSSLSHETQLVV